MKNLFIVQHGLVDRHSHFYGETKGWLEACRLRAISPRLYINMRALPEIATELSAKPAFAFPPDAILEPDPQCRELSDFIALGERFAQACAVLEADGISGGDMLLLPFSSERDLFGIALWLERLVPARRPAIALIFHLPPFAWKIEADRNKVMGDFSYFRYAMKRLRAVLPAEKIIIRATTRQFANFLANIFEHPCEKSPLAVYYMDAGLVRQSREQGPRVNVRIAGQFRWEKGSDIIIPVILKVAAARPNLCFAVQVEDQKVAQELARQMAPLEQYGAQCQVNFGNPSQEIYLARLEYSDILLLPYRAERYAWRASGVFAEAAAFGVVTVVPDRTWMSDMLHEGWGAGTVFLEATVSDVTAAVIGAIDGYSGLSQQARRNADAWRQTNSMDALLAHILKAAGHS